jgi:signal transduction histidine kinase
VTPLPSAAKTAPLDAVDVITGSDASTTSAPPANAPTRGPLSDPTAAVTGTRSDLQPAWCLLAAPVAIAFVLAGMSVAVGADGPTVTQIVGAILVALWTASGVVLGVRRRQDRLGPIVLAGAIVGGATCLAEALVSSTRLDDATHEVAAVGLRLGFTLLAACALHLFAALPDGRLTSRTRRRAVAVAYVVAVGVGAALCADLDTVAVWPVVTTWFVAVTAGVHAAWLRYREAGALERRRMQWIGWGLTVMAEGVLVMIALRLLTEWPDSPGTVALAMTGLVPLAIIAGTQPKMVARVDILLTRTVELAGLTTLVLAIYVIVVLGLGRTPRGSERTLLLLSMVAAGIAALLYPPARGWLTDRANRLVYGVRVAPDETLRTFGQRLTRSIPLDELMLQLAENLRSSMVLTSAEVWTGQDGRYELMAGVPHRRPPPIAIGPKELPVVARAGVTGGTWLDIWVPQLIGPSGSAAMRVAPVAHAGLLLGFIVVTRRPDGEPFTETEDSVLTEIARQIGLALHNVQLDTALQASLDELRVRNRELQESRARIVAAGDQERRKLERNLHDGAQQHLVALAVKLRLARDAVDDDPADAVAMIDEIKDDVQTAIAELRALAHGIFPPLLVSGGLADALPAAAGRAPLPTTVDLVDVGRYGNDIEAAVYFCTLEALQNAGKHAGAGALATVTVIGSDDVLRFEVHDDGAGFDMAGGTATNGHGFVNMADRLGAFGGRIEVTSAPGAGTTITGTIPLADAE